MNILLFYSLSRIIVFFSENTRLSHKKAIVKKYDCLFDCFIIENKHFLMRSTLLSLPKAFYQYPFWWLHTHWDNLLLL